MRQFTAALLLGASLAVQPALVPAEAAQRAPRPGAPESFADLVERVMPAVVNVSTSQAGPGGERDPQAASLGSGFIVDARGIVVTNNHVIRGADAIEVVLADGRTLPARLRATDAATDIAVLEIEAGGRYPAVSFGESDGLRVGDWVIAIGNPFGLGGSVSAGIVSGDERVLGGQYDDYIQTDAAINRGNSGGPLFDMAGRVVGVNTVIYSQTGGSVGVGFAINSGLASKVVEQLVEFGEVQRGFLGVTLADLDANTAARLGLPDTDGALVVRPRQGTPAAKAGLRADDVIVAYDGAPIASQRDLTLAVADTPAGSTVPLVVVRRGQRLTVEVTLERRQSAAFAALDDGTVRMAGLTLRPADAEAKRRFALADDVAGVVVTEVDRSSPIARTLRPGDVIMEVDWDALRDPQAFADALGDKRREGGTVQILVERGDRRFYETIRP